MEKNITYKGKKVISVKGYQWIRGVRYADVMLEGGDGWQLVKLIDLMFH